VSKQDESQKKRNYKWPQFVLAGALLFVLLAILWMSIAVHREKQERDFSAPIPTGTK
jgi:hypothetical protein